jgi:hypothetical protein
MKSKNKFTKKEAEIVGVKLGITWEKFDVGQFRKGMNVELEHGRINLYTNVSNDNSVMTGKIALAHLTEFPDYYTRLAKMEKEAKFWGKT